MGNPKSPEAFPDSREAMDKALESPKGIKIRFENEKQARRFRFNCYTVRRREQDRNARIYPADHPLHGASAYDKLYFTINLEDGVWKLTMAHGATVLIVEEL